MSAKPKKPPPAPSVDSLRLATQVRDSFQQLMQTQASLFGPNFASEKQEDPSAKPKKLTKSQLVKLLTESAQQGDTAGIQKALDAGIHVNSLGARRLSALSWAAGAQQPESIKLLLAHGARVQGDSSANTGYWRASTYFHLGMGSKDAQSAERTQVCYELLRQAGQDPLPSDLSELRVNSWVNPVLIALLVKDGLITPAPHEFAPLACSTFTRGAPELARQVLSKAPAGACSEQIEINAAELRDSPSPIARSLQGDNPLLLAFCIEQGFYAAVAQQGWRLRVTPGQYAPLDKPYTLPVMSLVALKAPRCARTLLNIGDPAFSIPPNDPSTAHLLYTQSSSAESLRAAALAGFDPSTRDAQGNTMLHRLFAAHGSGPSYAIELCRKHPGLDQIKNLDGQTAIDIGIQKVKEASYNQKKLMAEFTKIRIALEALHIKDAIGKKAPASKRASNARRAAL